MPTERWRSIPGYSGHEVSDHGRVRSIPRIITRIDGRRLPIKGRVLKHTTNELGHQFVDLALGRPHIKRRLGVHALMLMAFVGPRPEGAVTRHLNGLAWDNRLENLAWGTQSENIYDAVRHGKHIWANKTHCPRNHPYDEANTVVYGGRRYCRVCRRSNARANRTARKALAA